MLKVHLAKLDERIFLDGGLSRPSAGTKMMPAVRKRRRRCSTRANRSHYRQMTITLEMTDFGMQMIGETGVLVMTIGNIEQMCRGACRPMRMIGCWHSKSTTGRI
jgi:hypothetical protein